MPSGYIINKTLLFENILMVWNLSKSPVNFITIFKFQNWLVLFWQVRRPLTMRRCLSKNISQSISRFGSDWFTLSKFPNMERSRTKTDQVDVSLIDHEKERSVVNPRGPLRFISLFLLDHYYWHFLNFDSI